ncbi:MAG: hypothetical protein N2747_11355, partial [Chitinophagaceae bacterium]|nr:hypothetical protein [Chitinophagaceae bacterium]
LNDSGMLAKMEKCLDSNKTKLPKHIVILGHDQQFADEADFRQLEKFITALRRSGKYRLATMNEYPGIE